MSLTLSAVLLVGLLAATSSAAAGSRGCCAREAGCPEDMQQCRWMAPPACCDEPLAAVGSNAEPKPAIRVALLATAHPLEVPRSTPEQSSPSPQRVACATVVLRL
jgi:hypothetical protein